jgi:chromosome segregation protein
VAEEGEIVAASASLQKTAESLDEQIRSLEEERSTVRKELEEARTDLALTEGERNNRRSLWAGFEANLKNLQAQVETRTARARQLEEESRALTSRLSSARDEHEEVLAELTPLEEKLSPLRDGLTGIDDEESGLTQELESLRPRLTQLQQTLAQAQIEESQAQDEWRRLCSSMEEDGITVPEDLSPPDESLPDAAELERQIKRLRGRLGSLGSVDEETIKDYEETKSRYEFLSSQVNDLQKTEHSLQDAITELKGIIETQFVETFNKLGEEFSHYFTTFFGGGSAKLVLTQPDNPVESGIDIVARPPGKRLQNLAALSGGERALTGTALLFAVLRANPAPFCVLDEVDAALDDANIVRFAGALKGLSEQTQFILITHNRGTMEVADALYGVSMDDDSASTVLSLRLNGRGQAA